MDSDGPYFDGSLPFVLAQNSEKQQLIMATQQQFTLKFLAESHPQSIVDLYVNNMDSVVSVHAHYEVDFYLSMTSLYLPPELDVSSVSLCRPKSHSL